MKGTIASLFLLALELTLCLVSSRWRAIDVKDSQICFKNLLTRYNTTSSHYRNLHVGPLYSARIDNRSNTPQHFTSDHAKTEAALFITGIGLIVISAIVLTLVEFCSNKSFFILYGIWFHLVNVILLTASLVILIVGFYSLQHILKLPLNGGAALGFFIGILFIVMLATHSATKFWTQAWERASTKRVKETT